MPGRLDWQFANGVTLSRFNVEESLSPVSGTTQVVLYWAVRDSGPRLFTLRLQLVAADGRTLGAFSTVPLHGQIPVPEWLPGAVYREIYALPYTATGADHATIELKLLDPMTGQPWRLAGGAEAPRTLTTIAMTR